MPKKPKSGPPYTDIPSEVYVVVSFPWGMDRNPRSRSRQDYDRVASWAQLVLQQGGLGGGHLATIECIYGIGTRDEIIIQFEEGTNIVPLLGEHRWANIAKDWKGAPTDHRSTRVFLYNWRDNGDPSNHNWIENFPNCLPLDSIPAKSPYPAASWTAPPPSLTNFVLPIPPPATPPRAPERRDVPDMGLLPPKMMIPPLPPPEEAVQPAAPDSEFRPYEPPSQHPSHARFLNQKQGQSDNPPSPQASPSPPKFIKKLDPYELEEDALSILRAPDPIREDVKCPKNEELEPTLTLSTKAEDEDHIVPQVVPPASFGYQPSAELESCINAHLRNVATTGGERATPKSPVSMKREYEEDVYEPRLVGLRVVPPASLGYQPSAELEACINAHLRGMAAPGPSSASRSGTRAVPTSYVSVKREYEEDLAVSLVESKRIKVEEI